MKNLLVASLLSSVAMMGCVPQGTSDPNVNEFRRAIPSMNQLEAPMVTATTSTALGDPAEIPTSSYGLVIGTNGAIAALIGTLEAIVAQEPTVFNTDTQEYVWGPFENDDGIGYVAVYIRDVGDGEDFRYHYAFLRGVDRDLAKLEPVIWGGASPDANNDDHGVGVALYDFERNYQFEQANDPQANLAELPRGRFAVLFGKEPAEDNARNEFAFAVAAYRDFDPDGEAGADQAGSLDYLYGRYIDNEGGNTLDFVNWTTSMDVNEEPDGLAEDIDVLMAFLNEGTGRADATASGGSLGAESLALTECWDTSINQTYLSIGDLDLVGEVGNCAVFETGLRGTGIPTLEDIRSDNAGLYEALDTVASTGVPAE